MRTRIEADGPAVTLGDVFAGAGDAASRPIAPAPPAGQISTLGVDFLVAAAQSANLTFTPPPGIAEVRIVHPAGMRATVAPADANANVSANTTPTASSDSATPATSGVGVRRGETVLVTYQVPGLTLTTRARANSDAGVGQTLRLVNLQSNQIVEAVVTGPGAARANP